MSVRTNLIAIAIAAAALPAAFAQTTSVFVGGEAGWVDRPVQSAVTRTQVQSEFLRFRAAPPADANVGRTVSAEEGYAFPAHMYARQGGKWVCIDKIAHNPAPAAIKSPAEARAFQQQYPA